MIISPGGRMVAKGWLDGLGAWKAVIVETHSGRQVVIEIEEELWKVIRKWNYPRGTTYLETERCEHGLWVRSSIRDLKTAMGVS